MHGSIFAQFKKYTETKLGAGAWNKLLGEAGMGGRVFMAIQEYPDQDLVNLVAAASRVTGQPAGPLLQDFGEFMAPDMLTMYQAFVDPHWKTLDLIENTEHTIHKVVRLRNPGAQPPVLRCERPSEDEVLLHYASARKLCDVAKGFARGVARHFGETIVITETICMLKGGPECLMSIRRTA